MLSELINSKHIVGLKQTTRAVRSGSVKAVYIAKDVDKRVVTSLLQLCGKKGIPVISAPSMKEFGEALNVEVDTAVAAIVIEK